MFAKNQFSKSSYSYGFCFYIYIVLIILNIASYILLNLDDFVKDYQVSFLLKVQKK
jgi:hypothetical protein